MLERCALLLLIGCGQGGGTHEVQSFSDANPSSETDTEVPTDAPLDSQAGSAPEDAAEPLPSAVRAHRAGGEVIEGLQIATYDRAQWWDSRETPVIAIFREEDFADWPSDRSFSFLDDVTEIEAISTARSSYTHFMRSHGFVWQRVPLDGLAFVITAGESYHLQENGYGDFAWDLIRLGDNGVSYATNGAANEDYYIWGAEVYSPVSGVVVELVNNAPDNTPPAYPSNSAPNNLVGIHIGGGFYAYMLHFQQYSINEAWVVGSRVEVGDYVGLVGNSGVSAAPHLHLTFLWYDVNMARMWSVPSEFAGIFAEEVSRTVRTDFIVPQSGFSISNEPF